MPGIETLAARQPLLGRRILVTRPREQAGALAQALADAGALALLHPAIRIEPLADAGSLRKVQARLAEFDFAAFVSGNAVQFGLAGVAQLPPGLICLAPGPGTARALRERGASQVLLPTESYDSEGLLALPELQHLPGRRVLVLGGEGGRELLAESLRARGARVEVVSCYQRLVPQEELPALAELLLCAPPDATVFTSSEGLENLLQNLPEAAAGVLRTLPLFVPHPRIAERARSRGCLAVISTAGADAGVLAGLTEHFRRPTEHE
jgi:uroporphyrinogen-III synthase